MTPELATSATCSCSVQSSWREMVQLYPSKHTSNHCGQAATFLSDLAIKHSPCGQLEAIIEVKGVDFGAEASLGYSV